MRLRFSFFIILLILTFSINLHSKYIQSAYVRSKKLNLRDAPSIKSKIIYKLQRGTNVLILDKKKKWYKVKIKDENLIGWVYYSGLFRFKKEFIPDYKVKIKFNNFNETFQQKVLEFKRYLNFDFYKNDVEVVFSYNKEDNKLRIFIKTKFSLDYYNTNRDRSLKSNEVDLYPYINFAYVINKFIKKLEFKYPTCGEFLKKFYIDIMLKKSDDNYIILDLYRKRKLYKFSPFIIIKAPDYNIVKIYTENKEKLEKSYIFELEAPYYSYGIKSTAFLVYEFFNLIKG